MSETVAVYAVPHTPSFVAEVQVNGERSQTAQFFSKIRSHLENVKPDVIVTVNNDHFNTFFFDNWPTFAIGTAERTGGPNDQTPGMPRYDLAIETGAARHILRYLVEDGFDLTSSVDLELDHGALVPIAFHDAGNERCRSFRSSSIASSRHCHPPVAVTGSAARSPTLFGRGTAQRASQWSRAAPSASR